MSGPAGHSVPPAIAAMTIERVARAALESPDATVVDHNVVPLAYDAYLPGRSVWRIEGRAEAHGASRAWSAIRKWTDSPARTPGAPHDRGRREALAYGSGLLSDTSPLRVPRMLTVDLDDAGSIDLWLEDVGNGDPEIWDLRMFGEAARALGGFNGRSMARPIPALDWLVLDWAERQSEPVDLPATTGAIETAAASPRVREAFGAEVALRARRMLEDQPKFIELLKGLPQVLCHHDAARSNLIARPTADGGTEIVALDWESTGPGAIGADIATLVSGSVRKGDAPAADLAALDEIVFHGYLDGLREAGWRGQDNVVRLGYAASLALRCWLVRDTLRNLADPASQPVLGRAQHLGPVDTLSALAAISRFLLDRADEARELSARLSVPRRRP